MYPQESDLFWLPLLLTIVLSFLSFSKFLKNNRPIQPIHTQNSAFNTPSPSDSASASAAAEARGEYEVFLSFRGEDTRKGFTDFLFTYLVGASIRTFRDDNELRLGEEIGPDLLKAIKESKISIPIFSKNYASSKSCLLELAQMVECHRTEGQIIFPIFYDIEPSDVHNQKGSYEKAFRQHVKKFDEKTVQAWKDAMTMVGKLKGLELKKATNGHEGELVKMVVEKVVLELKKNYTHVPDNLVGMDHHVEEIERLLDVNCDGVRIVGIHGMGGIGKTTISKAIYNQLCDRFEYCCFLHDVRERSQHRNGIVFLQKELVSKFSNIKSAGIDNVDEGIKTIKDVVDKKKILVVLDDIDGIYQFNNLVGKCDWFGVRSRILVTTRNKELLDTLEVTYQREGLLEVYKSYEPQLMNDNHSLQLFCKYAFRRDFPPKHYKILSKDVVSTAAGLPLVLVTIGSLLFGKEDKALWEETLRKLRRIPYKEVLDKLKISFEALDHEQKQIFLDIACLFIGMDKEIPYYWDDCEFYPKNGINTLVLRSLVKVGDDNTLRMHDQLRDLGRQIVREENLMKPGERSRVWHPEEALDVLNGDLGTKDIEALNLDLRAVEEDEYEQLHLQGEVYEKLRTEGKEYYIRRLVGEDFNQLSNLRILRLGSVILDGDFKHLFPNLRWLKWRCWRKFIPVNLNLKNLLILDLSNSTTTDKWEGWTLFKVATKLKVLNLSGCRRLRRGPNFSTIARFKDLESLNLHACEFLFEVSVFECLESLKTLKASNCSALRTLWDLSNLKKLKELEIYGCVSLTDIQGLEKLESLELLDMRSCHSIQRLPDLSNLSMLKKLFLSKCLNLLEVGGLSNLRMLKELLLSYCVKLREIEGLGGLVSLEHLDMSGCNSMERFPDLSNLGNLKKLLCACEPPQEIEGLSSLVSLEVLHVTSCVSLPDLSNMRMLRKLILKGCGELREVGGLLGGLESLEHLDMGLCKSIERLPDLSNLRMLKTLDLNDCTKLHEIEGLSGLVSLETLKLQSCSLLEKLPDLSSLKSLKEIDAEGCEKLPEIKGLSGLVSLETLMLRSCKLLEKLPDLSNLKSLKTLDAQGCEKLREIQGLEELEKRGCWILFYRDSYENISLSDLRTLLDCSGYLRRNGVDHSRQSAKAHRRTKVSSSLGTKRKAKEPALSKRKKKRRRDR